MWVTAESLSDPYNVRADEACAAASHILWALSGRKYSGTHNVVEFYDARGGLGDISRLQYANALLPLSPNVVTCTNCGFPHRLRLRHQPVQRILSVELNGTLLTPSDFALLDNATLGFPISLTTCAATCARVSYIWGVNPPAGGKAAAAILAQQLLYAWTGSDECRLPKRVTNITRQGVSWTILDPQDFLNDGRTGIFEIDLFLKAVNPDKARRPARVFSPDLPRAQTISQDVTPPVVEIDPDDLAILSAGETAWYVTRASLWPGGSYTPYAVINSITYDSTHFTLNGDGSQTLVLSGSETYGLVEGDTFLIKAHPSSGPDVTVVSGSVRYVQG